MKKRILSLVLSSAMVLSMSVSAFASGDVVSEYTDLDEISGLELDGEGTIVYDDLEVVSVILPTSKALEFVVDPQGLVAVTSEGILLKDLDAIAGTIISNTTPQFVNNSTFPLKLTATIKATGDATFMDESKATADIHKNAANPDNNAQLFIIPAAYNTPNTSTINADFAVSKNALILETTAITLDYALPAADYTVTPSSASGKVVDLNVVDGSGTGSAFAIGGFINKYADWESSTIGINVVFTAVDDTLNLDESAGGEPYEASDFETASGIENLLTSTAGDTSATLPGRALPKVTSDESEWEDTMTITLTVTIPGVDDDFAADGINASSTVIRSVLNAGAMATLGTTEPKFEIPISALADMFDIDNEDSATTFTLTVKPIFLGFLESDADLDVMIGLDGFKYPVEIKIPAVVPED